MRRRGSKDRRRCVRKIKGSSKNKINVDEEGTLRVMKEKQQKEKKINSVCKSRKREGREEERRNGEMKGDTKGEEERK